MSARQYTLLDRLLNQLDQAVRDVFADERQIDQLPAIIADNKSGRLSAEQRTDVRRMLRARHSLSLCAQGMYHGQLSLLRFSPLRTPLAQLLANGDSLLRWYCARLHELGCQPSRFNAIVYCGGYGVGAMTVLLGEPLAAAAALASQNELQNSARDDIRRLPGPDRRSRAVLASTEAFEHDAEAELARHAPPVLLGVAATTLGGLAGLTRALSRRA